MPLDKDIENILDPLLATFGGNLTTEVSGQLTTIYTSGSAEMITWGKTKGGVPIAYEGPPISQAVSWAEKEGARLVTQMDTETKRRMALTISDGIKNKRGVPGLSRDIRKTFSDMSKHRSELIARTETANALSQASLDRMEDMGIEGKEWITVGDDRVSDECKANGNQGVISTKKSFTSGPMAPPQHPDCRCAIAPARLAKGKEPPEVKGIQQAERDFTDKYGSAKSEYGQSIDLAGNVLLTKRGTAKTIKYTADEFKQMTNAKSFIHNHPGVGGPFSPDDILMARGINVGRMVVVDSRYKYTMAPVENWSEAGKFAGTYRMSYGFARRHARSRWKADRTLTAREVNVSLQEEAHEILTRLAPKYGINYSRGEL